MTEQKDWKKESFDILKNYQATYGFKNSVLHNIHLNSFRIDGKTRYWITINRDGVCYEYMYKTWKELFASLEGMLIGIHICEGSGVKRRGLIKELVEQGVHMDTAHKIVDKGIAEGKYS